jgi:hypothetical protein
MLIFMEIQVLILLDISLKNVLLVMPITANEVALF